MGFEVPIFSSVDRMAAFLLVFMRMTGMFLSAPLFSNRSFPIRIRVWFAFLLSVATFEVAYQLAESGVFAGLFRQPSIAAVAVAGELAIGWIIGWVASMVLWAAQLAGHIVGQEIGLTLATVFDPVSEIQGSVTTQLFFTFAMVMFVALDGHHLLILGITDSFRAAPPGSFPFHFSDGAFLGKELGSAMWSTGLRMALPAMMGLLFVTVVLGILARAVPEMNIFIVGFGVRVIFGLLALVVIIPFIADVLQEVFTTTEPHLVRLIESWGGG